MEALTNTYPSFTEAPADKLGFIGHGVELSIDEKDRSKVLGRRLPNMPEGVFVRMDEYGDRIITVFTYSASSRVYRYKAVEINSVYLDKNGKIAKEPGFRLQGERVSIHNNLRISQVCQIAYEKSF